METISTRVWQWGQGRRSMSREGLGLFYFQVDFRHTVAIAGKGHLRHATILFHRDRVLIGLSCVDPVSDMLFEGHVTHGTVSYTHLTLPTILRV